MRTKSAFCKNKPQAFLLSYYAYTCRSAILLLLCNLPIHSKYLPIWLQRLMLQDILTKSKVPLGSRVCTQHRQWAMMGLIVIFLLLSAVWLNKASQVLCRLFYFIHSGSYVVINDALAILVFIYIVCASEFDPGTSIVSTETQILRGLVVTENHSP